MGKNLRSLIRRLQKGDQSAFLPLYEKTAPGLLRFLLWKTSGDRPSSEDILQEAFVRFLVNLDRLESDNELAIQSYLLRIVKHCLIDKLGRAAYRRRESVSLDAVAETSDPQELSRQERAVEVRELAIAMNTLNEKDSEIIWLRDALGFSHREVANQFGISEQASRQAYVRAKRTLIAQLSPAMASSDLTEGGSYASPELSKA